MIPQARDEKQPASPASFSHKPVVQISDTFRIVPDEPSFYQEGLKSLIDLNKGIVTIEEFENIKQP